MDQLTVRERMTAPVRALGIVDTDLELRRIEGRRPHLCPDDLLRMDALQLRWRELHGETVEWPLLTDCGECHGGGWDAGDRYTPVLPCLACHGRGKVQIAAEPTREVA